MNSNTFSANKTYIKVLFTLFALLKSYIDTTAKPVKGSIVACHYNGDKVIRRLEKKPKGWALTADDPREENLYLTEFSDYKLLGVITFAINDCRMLATRVGAP